MLSSRQNVLILFLSPQDKLLLESLGNIAAVLWSTSMIRRFTSRWRPGRDIFTTVRMFSLDVQQDREDSGLVVLVNNTAKKHDSNKWLP